MRTDTSTTTATPVPGVGMADRLRDRLPINAPYDGLLAEGYDTWIPVDEAWPDEAVYRRLLAGVEGPVLELGCGTGRPLLRWLAEGVPVEGLDASADMLAVLRRHAVERGLEPVLHHGDMAPLALGRAYGAIVCLAGTFCLVARADVAAALASYREHLEPGGLLALTLFSLDAGDEGASADGALRWRLRRSGTAASGHSYLVSEAVHLDDDANVQVAYHRVEQVDPDGRVVDTVVRRFHLQRWTPPAVEAALAAAGFADVETIGDERGWVAAARRPA